MYTEDIAQARAQLLHLEGSVGQGVSLAHVAQLETLWEMIQHTLKGVSGHIGSLADFYDALAQLRPFVEFARETLRLLEKENDDHCFSRTVSQEAWTIIRTLFRPLSQDLDDLSWCLPPEFQRRKRAPRPIAVPIRSVSDESSRHDQSLPVGVASSQPPRRTS